MGRCLQVVCLLLAAKPSLGDERSILLEIGVSGDDEPGSAGGGNCLLQLESGVRHASVDYSRQTTVRTTTARLPVVTQDVKMHMPEQVAAITKSISPLQSFRHELEQDVAAPKITLQEQLTNRTRPEGEIAKAATVQAGITLAQMAQLQKDIGAAVLVSALSDMDNVGFNDAEGAGAKAAPLAGEENAEQAPDATEEVSNAGESKKKNKVGLLIIEMFPICWPLGIDRFYLGDIWMGFAKLAVCVCTCFVGGVVWGLIDFVAIILNALQARDSINVIGLNASFDPAGVKVAQIVAVVDIVMVFVWVGVIRALYQYRQRRTLERLMETHAKAYGQPAASGAINQGGC